MITVDPPSVPFTALDLAPPDYPSRQEAQITEAAWAGKSLDCAKSLRAVLQDELRQWRLSANARLLIDKDAWVA